MKLILIIALFAAASATYGVSTRPSAPAIADTTCRPPLHECPKCNGDGYYCGEYCMDCPELTTPDTDISAVTCGGKICGADTYCCNTGCGAAPHCLPDGAACPAHTCD